MSDNDRVTRLFGKLEEVTAERQRRQQEMRDTLAGVTELKQAFRVIVEAHDLDAADMVDATLVSMVADITRHGGVEAATDILVDLLQLVREKGPAIEGDTENCGNPECPVHNGAWL